MDTQIYNPSFSPIANELVSAKHGHQNQIDYHEAAENVTGTYGSFSKWAAIMKHHKDSVERLTKLIMIYHEMHRIVADMARERPDSPAGQIMVALEDLKVLHNA